MQEQFDYLIGVLQAEMSKSDSGGGYVATVLSARQVLQLSLLFECGAKSKTFCLLRPPVTSSYYVGVERKDVSAPVLPLAHKILVREA